MNQKKWTNNKTGQSASIYGAAPWHNEEQKKDWQLVTVGFTWRLDNGSVGLGRIPAKTLREAMEIMQNFNKGTNNG